MDELSARRAARHRARELRYDRLMVFAVHRIQSNHTLGPELRLFARPSKSLRRRVMRLVRIGWLEVSRHPPQRLWVTGAGSDELYELDSDAPARS